VSIAALLPIVVVIAIVTLIVALIVVRNRRTGRGG
jgi:hypothetical protein